jgi:hypothetical protein
MVEGFLKGVLSPSTTVVVDTGDNKIKTAASDAAPTDEKRYRQAIGKLQYLAQGTRPDIAFAVGVLGRFRSQPSSAHWIGVKRILRYLGGTRDVGLTWTGGGDRGQAGLHGYADSDFMGDNKDLRSTGAYAFLFGGAAVTWRSRKQAILATSTTEAEYMALFEAAKEAKWLKHLVEVLYGGVAGRGQPVVLYEDNKSAIRDAEEPSFHPRTKHIGMQFHKTRELQQDGIVNVVYMPTAGMVADVLTKALSKKGFGEKVELLGLRKMVSKVE